MFWLPNQVSSKKQVDMCSTRTTRTKQKTVVKLNAILELRNI